MSEKEENKHLYNRLTNAYAIRTESFLGSPHVEPVGPAAVGSRYSKKNGPLIGVALLVALLICFAAFFGILRW